MWLANCICFQTLKIMQRKTTPPLKGKHLLWFMLRINLETIY
jgi:hypothetical protein